MAKKRMRIDGFRFWIYLFFMGSLIPAALLNAEGIENPYLSGARAAGMGNASVAVGDMDFKMNNNLASLSTVKNIDVDFMYTQLYGLDLSWFNCEIDKRVSPKLGLGIGADVVGDFMQSSVSYLHLLLKGGLSFLALSSEKYDFAVGAGIRVNQMSLGDSTDKNMSKQSWNDFAGGGLLTFKDVFAEKNNLRAGIQYSTGDAGFAAGVSYHLVERELLLSYAVSQAGKTRHSFGIEKSFQQRLKIRTGLYDGYFNCGLSLAFNVFNINYAFGMSAINNINIISINLLI